MNLISKKMEFVFPIAGAVLLALALLMPNAILAYAITLILALAAFFLPKQGILFLLIYYPLRSFLITVNPALKLLGDVIIVFVFLRIMWNSRNNWTSIFKFAVYEWAFLGFLFVGALSALINDIGMNAIIFQIRAFVITFLLLYVVKRLDITKKDMLNFMYMTVAVVILVLIQGLVEKVSVRSQWMPELWVNRQLSPNNSSRIYGLLNNPNVLAVYLTITALLTYYLRRLTKSSAVRVFLTIILVVMAGVWILTYSRGTWIAFAISLAVYFVFTFNWKLVLKIAAVIAIGFVLVALPATYSAQWVKSNTKVGEIERTGPAEDEGGFAVEKTRIKETFNANTFEKSLTTGRLYVVSKGFEVFKDYPLIGSGFATFGDSAAKSFGSPVYKDYDIGVDIYSDNQYIQIIAQTGIAGVLLFAVFLLGILVLFWKNRHNNPLAIPLLAAMIGIYWCGFIYNIWEDKTFTMYFYIILAGFLACLEPNEKQKI
ncbi:O-antigen ligase family protein [Sporosarcina gallistercoris]|uniref:O-antigen ligase family protein n=1 Tax=Sporosarcina gallistercoris TaxID=2762245 RepID=A0ABR8PM99_9BACL|nr:O-antigen ligase family protein [Sporosarcina gallistercoris]MBD7909286.1 O-antigen ligase family protein [Sporosarcina gallistercoris]